MKKSKIGNTDIEVSRIGLGTVKFGRNQGVKYPKPFELPSDSQIRELLDKAKELGVNLLDTAPAYGTSEERLGKLIKDERDDWVLSTKVGEEFVDGKSYFDFSPQAIGKSVERSLKRLHTDVIDIVLVHSDGQDAKHINDDEVFVTLENLKQAGKLRAYGMSTKTIEGGMLTIDHADIAMVTYNINYQIEKPLIDYAKQKKKGLFVKKALDSGRLNPEEALRFVCKEAAVDSLILGSINSEHVSLAVLCSKQVENRRA